MNTIRARAEAGEDSFLISDPRFVDMLKKVGLPPLN
jgi:hypothetical protein